MFQTFRDQYSFDTQELKKPRVTFSRRCRSEAGDVPGWVLITLMTSVLVILIWAAAGPALSDLFQQAVDRVSDM